MLSKQFSGKSCTPLAISDMRNKLYNGRQTCHGMQGVQIHSFWKVKISYQIHSFWKVKISGIYSKYNSALINMTLFVPYTSLIHRMFIYFLIFDIQKVQFRYLVEMSNFLKSLSCWYLCNLCGVWICIVTSLKIYYSDNDLVLPYDKKTNQKKYMNLYFLYFVYDGVSIS